MLMQNEIEAMRRLAHPSVVQVFDAGITDDGCVYIAMELVGGEPLDRYLAHRTRLDAIEAIRLAATISEAVAVCHDLDILHLDLKPHNVVLEDPHAPAVKVLDFGLAHVTSAWEAGSEASGTPHYMSPEPLRGRETGCPRRSLRNRRYPLRASHWHGAVWRRDVKRDLRGQESRRIRAREQDERRCAPRRGSADHGTASARTCVTAELGAAPRGRVERARVSDLGWLQPAPVGQRAPPHRAHLDRRSTSTPSDDMASSLDCSTQRGTQSELAGAGVVLAGETGVGKSRLVSRYLEGLGDTTDVAVGYGRCRELNNALPFSPWREALGRLAEAKPDRVNALAASLAPVAGLLSRLVPEMSTRLTNESDADDGTPVEVAITALLATVGTTQPCVVVIEDLQWADAGSRTVVEHFAKVGIPAGITIIATTRDADDRPDGFGVIELAPLSLEDGDKLIAVGLGSDEPEVVTELKRHAPLLATGNPLITIQVLRHLEAVRCLVREGEQLRIDHERLRNYEPPASVGGVVAASLGELTSQTRSIMAVGALLGRSFRCGDLYKLNVFEPEAVKRAFSEALEKQVISRSGCGGAAIFLHDTIREELTKSIADERRRRLHLRVAEMLAKRQAAPAELAHHYDRGGDKRNAARTHVAAGRQALALNASFDAASHLERAASNALDSPPSQLRDRLLSQATSELVAASAQTGNTVDTLAHLDRCRDAIEEPSLETRIALEAGYARAFYVRGDFDRAGEHGTECLRLAGGDPEFTSYTLIPLALSGRAKTASGRFGPAADVLATVVELAEAQGRMDRARPLHRSPRHLAGLHRQVSRSP